MSDDLIKRIDSAMRELHDNDPYGWADAIKTLVDCRKELDRWRASALAATTSVNALPHRIDLNADQ